MVRKYYWNGTAWQELNGTPAPPSFTKADTAFIGDAALPTAGRVPLAGQLNQLTVMKAGPWNLTGTVDITWISVGPKTTVIADGSVTLHQLNYQGQGEGGRIVVGSNVDNKVNFDSLGRSVLGIEPSAQHPDIIIGSPRIVRPPNALAYITGYNPIIGSDVGALSQNTIDFPYRGGLSNVTKDFTAIDGTHEHELVIYDSPNQINPIAEIYLTQHITFIAQGGDGSGGTEFVPTTSKLINNLPPPKATITNGAGVSGLAATSLALSDFPMPVAVSTSAVSSGRDPTLVVSGALVSPIVDTTTLAIGAIDRSIG